LVGSGHRAVAPLGKVGVGRDPEVVIFRLPAGTEFYGFEGFVFGVGHELAGHIGDGTVENRRLGYPTGVGEDRELLSEGITHTAFDLAAVDIAAIHFEFIAVGVFGVVINVVIGNVGITIGAEGRDGVAFIFARQEHT